MRTAVIEMKRCFDECTKHGSLATTQWLNLSSTPSKQTLKNPVLMIVGFGHLRHGMGIPERIAYLRPETKQINFSMMEISQEPSSIESYLPEFEINGRTFRQDFDYIWFTSRQEMEDPCKAFRKQTE